MSILLVISYPPGYKFYHIFVIQITPRSPARAPSVTSPRLNRRRQQRASLHQNEADQTVAKQPVSAPVSEKDEVQVIRIAPEGTLHWCTNIVPKFHDILICLSPKRSCNFTKLDCTHCSVSTVKFCDVLGSSVGNMKSSNWSNRV